MNKFLIAVTIIVTASLSSAQGIINAFLGGGSNSKDDNIPATSVALNLANDVLVDPSGNVYVADSNSGIVRKVNASGIATIIAGTTSRDGGSTLDNIPVLTAQLNPKGIALDAAGNLYIADAGSRIRKVNSAGIITTIAGARFTGGFRGDGGPATNALFNGANHIALDTAGNLYVADSGNNRIRKIDTNGIITTIAGTGTAGFAGDGGQAANAKLSAPSSVAFDPAGNLYIADTQNHRVRKIDTAGVIGTVAGDGSATCCHGDGGPALSGGVETPFGVATDSSGNLYIATGGRIAKVDTGGIINTAAGNGLQGLPTFGTAEGALATKAFIGTPLTAAVDNRTGNYYIVTPGLIWKVTVSSATPPYVCTNTVAPTVTAVVSASAFGGYPYFASGSWLEVYGTNLADPSDPRLKASTNPGQWTASDFSGVNAPTLLDGIKASINGKPAYVWYLSPGQINVQAPEDTATGSVSITVSNCNATSSAFTFARRPLAPGLLAPSSYNVGGTQYMVATFVSDAAYVLNTSAGAALGINSRPAKPGDLIIAYGIGFGDVTPSILPGVIVGQSNMLTNPVTISFGTTPATLSYSGLAGNFVGLYEFYITVPAGLANGDYQINVLQNGANVPQTMYLSVHN